MQNTVHGYPKYLARFSNLLRRHLVLTTKDHGNTQGSDPLPLVVKQQVKRFSKQISSDITYGKLAFLAILATKSKPKRSFQGH